MLIAYYRVSTEKQGYAKDTDTPTLAKKRKRNPGLGLDAQKEAVKKYSESAGRPVIQEFIEIESGRCKKRPQLAKAVQAAKALKARLVVAKLDRLSRRVSITAHLMDSVDFAICDNPNATPLTIQVLAAVAEQEVKAISTRIKEALSQLKARGVKLGAASDLPNVHRFSGSEMARRGANAANAVIREKVGEFRATMRQLIVDKLNQGMGLAAVASWLNESGYKTYKGKPWTKFAVCKVAKRREWESKAEF